MHRIAYTGRAAVAGQFDGIETYRLGENGTLLQLTGIIPDELLVTPERGGWYNYGSNGLGISSYSSLIRQMQQKARAEGAATPPPLKTAYRIDEALQDGVLTESDLVFREVSALPILHSALSTGPDTAYFRKLRRDVGPSFDQDRIVAQARATGRTVWDAIIAGGVALEPVATGLEDVAYESGIFTPNDTPPDENRIGNWGVNPN